MIVKDKSDFSITIDFDKNSPNPSRVFKSMASIIEGFEALDKDLVQHIDNKIETIMLLEDVEKGSIKALLANILKNIPDSAIEDLSIKKILGHYLVKAKYIYLKNTEKTLTLTDAKEIDIIEMELKQVASEYGIDKIPTYVPINKKCIIKNLDNISKSLEPLSKTDAVVMDSQFGKASFNLELSIDMDNMEDLITDEVYESEIKMILKVKKPDYLGDSKWEFKHGGKTLNAKILDSEWLVEFQKGNKPVMPQDSLVCMVKTINKYDYNFDLLSVTYDITRVIHVNKRPQNNQTSIIDG